MRTKNEGEDINDQICVFFSTNREVGKGMPNTALKPTQTRYQGDLEGDF